MSTEKMPRLSELGSSDWEGIIDDATTREDWFSGFTNSVTYFEHWGYWKLRWYCIKKGIMGTSSEKEKLRNLHVSNLVLILHLLKLIDQDTYSRINKIIQERNKLVHPGRAGISYRDRKQKDRAVELLIDAKACIKKLKQGIGRMQEV